MGRTRVVLSQPESWAAVVRDLAPSAVAVDVEPLLVDWADPGMVPATAVARAVLDLELVASLAVVVFATNSHRTAPGLPDSRLQVSWVSRAHKPWARTRLRRLHPGPWVVVGDQVVTDGWLARRLDGVFVRVVHPPELVIPRWPSLQAAVAGRVLQPWFRER